jgi:Arc/MetJ family transcription regulator
MKRTNLVLDEELLKEATRVLGQKTYSATVNAALKEIVRQKQVEELADFVGKLEWIGDLSEMREDRPVRREKSPGKSPAKAPATGRKAVHNRSA